MEIQKANPVPEPPRHQPELTGLPAPCRSARSYRQGGFTVVEARGALDLCTVPDLRTHTDAATAEPGAQALVDLRLVDFLDCSALGLLCRTRRRALEQGGHLVLVCAAPRHLRILEATALKQVFAPFGTVQEALDGRR
ncbi:STAS domain-containing protein [Streptomyces sp. BH-SS-21]|uniref:Anti-sigma factor antagonist n=1 Tax=Streptomyces liliiviolaceus TaxID=2823109 RepID=A0A940XUL9_9ACTN|nr:STAS domain-containing protein [Streptomyces liliiviolaceus]MBQ0850220.1 STAS domain-containing protein [Streptomyces liliiviolaceus]